MILIQSQIILGLLPINVRVYIIKGGIYDILARLGELLIEPQGTMAPMEGGITALRKVKTASRESLILVRCVEEVCRLFILMTSHV